MTKKASKKANLLWIDLEMTGDVAEHDSRLWEVGDSAQVGFDQFGVHNCDGLINMFDCL